MPTIKARKQANGITRYTAIVRIGRGAAILHRESRTFAHRSAAVSWVKHHEVVLEDPSARTRVQHGAVSLSPAAASSCSTRRFRSADSESPWRAAAAAKRSLRSALTQLERCVLRFSMQHI